MPENEHDLRGVTDRLYGGDQEHRMQQEILAGIGGGLALVVKPHFVFVLAPACLYLIWRQSRMAKRAV